ncbi:MAG: sugar ABC transporter ATP-binding protein [Arachnia sp.]
MSDNQTAWRAEGIVKSYSGTTVLKGVSISLAPGEVVGLVGHNGAGKSTLLKCLSGAVQPDSGVMHIDGQEHQFGSPIDALKLGVSTVYQELALLPNLTITENIFLGEELTTRGTLNAKQMRRVARELVAEFNLDVDVDRKLGDYPVATRQLLEIAVATHRDCRFLLLDEPTTSLESAQVKEFLDLVRELSKERGIGILLIDHKLSELYAVADRIFALVDGEMRIDAAVADVPQEAVIEAITGEPAGHEGGEASAAPDVREALGAGAEVTLEVSHLRTKDLEDVSLRAHAGRVLGIYGLIGSGRTEFLRTLVGLDPVDAGEVRLFGAPYRPKNPADAQARGIAYLTEERKIDGIIPLRDGTFNVTIPVVHRFTDAGFLLKPRAMAKAGQELMDRVRVRGNRLAPIASLSGGNQQKVLLARVLGQDPKVLLLDEPTKGVDIGVKVEIHHLLRTLAAEQGMTVIVVSSEEEEILAVADDVAVFADGSCTGQTSLASDLTETDLRKAAWAAA